MTERAVNLFQRIKIGELHAKLDRDAEQRVAIAYRIGARIRRDSSRRHADAHQADPRISDEVRVRFMSRKAGLDPDVLCKVALATSSK